MLVGLKICVPNFLQTKPLILCLVYFIRTLDFYLDSTKYFVDPIVCGKIESQTSYDRNACSTSFTFLMIDQMNKWFELL